VNDRYFDFYCKELHSLETKMDAYLAGSARRLEVYQLLTESIMESQMTMIDLLQKQIDELNDRVGIDGRDNSTGRAVTCLK